MRHKILDAIGDLALLGHPRGRAPGGAARPATRCTPRLRAQAAGHARRLGAGHAAAAARGDAALGRVLRRLSCRSAASEPARGARAAPQCLSSRGPRPRPRPSPRTVRCAGSFDLIRARSSAILPVSAGAAETRCASWCALRASGVRRVSSIQDGRAAAGGRRSISITRSARPMLRSTNSLLHDSAGADGAEVERGGLDHDARAGRRGAGEAGCVRAREARRAASARRRIQHALPSCRSSRRPAAPAFLLPGW